MNKKSILALLLFIMSIGFNAEAVTKIQARVGALYPWSGSFKETYGSLNPDYQIEVSTSLNKCLDVWSNFDWFNKSKSIGGTFSYSTKIQIATVSTGLSYIFPCYLLPAANFYLGAGVSLQSIYLMNKTRLKKESWEDVTVGGVIKSGLTYFFCQSIFLDIFADYTYQSVKVGKRCQVGGIKFGLGVGTFF